MCSKQPKTFAFDHCFYSIDTTAAHFASQEKVFDCVGRDILYNAFEGYNACIFAYGQTGECFSYATFLFSNLRSDGDNGFTTANINLEH